MNIVKNILILVFAGCITCGNASDSDIKIYFSSKSDPSNGILVNISDASDVAKTQFSSSKNTIFYIHGWLDKNSSASGQSIKNALLTNQDINMFLVDWSSIADNILYPVAFTYVESIGNTLGSQILSLVQNSLLNLDKTAIVGHSLGAHVAGVAGRKLEGKLDYIVGLDPAGPLFTKDNTANRLTTSSAKFVQAIHSCGSILGYFDPIGHADYYPNGGRSQPMCFLIDITCSHLKSIDYYSESVLTGNFKSKKCANYDDYKNGYCNNAEASNMGEYNIDKKASGTYFLNTNNASPYAQN